MDPFNFNYPFPQAGAPVWPPGLNPTWFPAQFSYGMQPMQPASQLQQPQQPSTPQTAGIHHMLNYSTPSTLPAADLQPSLQPPPHIGASCFITPPSDNRDCSPPPTLQLMQLPNLQPTPTGRPMAAAAAAAGFGAVAAAADVDRDKENDQPSSSSLALVPRKQALKRKLGTDSEETANRFFNDPATDVFCQVGGRLSVVGGARTYSVTVAEIERRTRAPECVPLSLLGPLLKRGKVKGCGDKLKGLLQERQIPSGGTASDSRRKPPVSTLSALLEEEAAHLSADHADLLASHFPLVFVARLLVLQLHPTPAALAACAAEAAAAHPIISSLSSLLSEWSSHSPASPLTEFGLVTHSLGFPQSYPDIPAPDANMQQEAAMLAMGPIKFGEVDGRLTLHSRKYLVTVAEITRRLRAPESLNLSTLGSILRRGKTSNNGSELRDELSKHGIRVDQGRRKGAKLTCFTALLEGKFNKRELWRKCCRIVLSPFCTLSCLSDEEALILARDLGEAMGRFFPVSYLAAELNSRAQASTTAGITQRSTALAAASRLAASLSETLASLRLPISDRQPSSISPYAHLMRNYSSLTHGYGPEVCVLWLEAFRKVYDASRERLPLTC